MNDTRHTQLPTLDRRLFLRGAAAAGAAGLLAACGGGGSSSSSSAASVSKGPPSYYPKSYDSIVKAAKKEDGLTIYSNMAEYNWQPIIEVFKAKYPDTGDISTNNLDSSEVFQRYYAESASGTSAASLMVSGDPTSWIDFIKKHKAAAAYKSPEIKKLPKIGTPLPNLYTFSTDPILLAYNKSLLEENERPTGMQDLADLVSGDTERFQDKVTTYDVENSFGFAIERTWAQTFDGGWDLLEKILPVVRAEGSSGPMVDKINAGEYLVGFFMSSTVVLPQAEKTDAILGWTYIDDGTPMMFRGMAMPKTAPQSATAKLMLDFLLSYDGQVAVYEGGFTPFRDDLSKDDAPRSYKAIANEVGKDNVIDVAYDAISADEAEAFRSKWDSAMSG